MYGLELHERSDSRATAPDTHLSFSDTTLCGYAVLQACTLIAIWCATTHDNKTHTPYDYMLHIKHV